MNMILCMDTIWFFNKWINTYSVCHFYKSIRILFLNDKKIFFVFFFFLFFLSFFVLYLWWILSYSRSSKFCSLKRAIYGSAVSPSSISKASSKTHQRHSSSGHSSIVGSILCGRESVSLRAVVCVWGDRTKELSNFTLTNESRSPPPLRLERGRHPLCD